MSVVHQATRNLVVPICPWNWETTTLATRTHNTSSGNNSLRTMSLLLMAVEEYWRVYGHAKKIRSFKFSSSGVSRLCKIEIKLLWKCEKLLPTSWFLSPFPLSLPFFFLRLLVPKLPKLITVSSFLSETAWTIHWILLLHELISGIDGKGRKANPISYNHQRVEAGFGFVSIWYICRIVWFRRCQASPPLPCPMAPNFSPFEDDNLYHSCCFKHQHFPFSLSSLLLSLLPRTVSHIFQPAKVV